MKDSQTLREAIENALTITPLNRVIDTIEQEIRDYLAQELQTFLENRPEKEDVVEKEIHRLFIQIFK